MGLSLPHILLLALVVLLLFGGGRVSGLMGDVAKGIKTFKKGMKDDEDDTAAKPADPASKPLEHGAAKTAAESSKAAG